MPNNNESNDIFYNLIKNSSICDNIINLIYSYIKPYIYLLFFFIVIIILLLIIIISEILHIKDMFKIIY